MLVGSPHAQHLAPVLYVLAGGASAAVEALAVFHAEADDACGGGVSRLSHVALVLRIVVITDYTIVFCHHEAAELVDHGFGKRLDFRAATLVEYNLADDGITLGILQADGARRFIDADARRCSAYDELSFFVTYFLTGCRPIGLDYAITVEKGLGKLPVRAYANMENIPFAGLHTDGKAILECDSMHRICNRKHCGKQTDNK